MIYLFGPFKLDTKKREILFSGDALNIQPRVYELILLLVSHHDQALDKNMIQEAIWPNQILSETSLSRLVMKARKALDDSSDNPKYIRTVHGFGFQFIAKVSEQDPCNSVRSHADSVLPDTSIPTLTRKADSKPGIGYKWIIGILFSIVSISFLILYSYHPVLSCLLLLYSDPMPRHQSDCP